jgi:hypothetical protein
MKDTTKEFQLPREFGEKWIKALRSGEYKQNTDAQLLVPETGCYCALGVFAVANGMELSDDGMDVLIDGKLADYKPFKDLMTKEGMVKIYRLNDSKDATFPELADWIERNVEFV